MAAVGCLRCLLHAPLAPRPKQTMAIPVLAGDISCHFETCFFILRGAAADVTIRQKRSGPGFVTATGDRTIAADLAN